MTEKYCNRDCIHFESDYCFMDNGISIPGSFKKSNIPFKNDCDAIIQAVNGMSTKKEHTLVEELD